MNSSPAITASSRPRSRATLEDAYARNDEARSAVSAAHASYVEAVGIAGAGNNAQGARRAVCTWCSRATSRLVEQAAREYERDPDPALPGQADVNRPADVESEPSGDFAGWVRQINAAVADAERAAGEAEQAAAGSGRWFSRSSACINAEGRVAQASIRVQNLTFGTRRPRFIPAEGGRQAWDELRERLDEAGRRARAACSSIEPPR